MGPIHIIVGSIYDDRTSTFHPIFHNARYFGRFAFLPGLIF